MNPNTGLHPRPASPSRLAPLFPPDTVDRAYASTLFPSRRGETLRELQDRVDLFVEAWTARTEAGGARCVVVFAHAASVIALGRAVSVAGPACYISIYASSTSIRSSSMSVYASTVIPTLPSFPSTPPLISISAPRTKADGYCSS